MRSSRLPRSCHVSLAYAYDQFHPTLLTIAIFNGHSVMVMAMTICMVHHLRVPANHMSHYVGAWWSVTVLSARLAFSSATPRTNSRRNMCRQSLITTPSQLCKYPTTSYRLIASVAYRFNVSPRSWLRFHAHPSERKKEKGCPSPTPYHLDIDRTCASVNKA